MNDDEIRKLFRKGVIKTSDKFTENLMQKVELQRNAERRVKMRFLVACSIGLALLLLFLFKLPLAVDLPNAQLTVSPIVIRVLGSLSVFIILNKLIILRGELLKAGNTSAF